MPKPKTQPTRGIRAQPQLYEHRVEVVLEALSCAAGGLHRLTTYLLEQLTPDWKRQNRLVRSATADFRRACRWLREVEHPTLRRPGPGSRTVRGRAVRR